MPRHPAVLAGALTYLAGMYASPELADVDELVAALPRAVGVAQHVLQCLPGEPGALQAACALLGQVGRRPLARDRVAAMVEPLVLPALEGNLGIQGVCAPGLQLALVG